MGAALVDKQEAVPNYEDEKELAGLPVSDEKPFKVSTLVDNEILAFNKRHPPANATTSFSKLQLLFDA